MMPTVEGRDTQSVTFLANSPFGNMTVGSAAIMVRPSWPRMFGSRCQLVKEDVLPG